MPQFSAHAILTQCSSALGLPDHVIEWLSVTGTESLPSCFPVTDLAVASIGAAGLALADLMAAQGQTVRVEVDRRMASLWFDFTIAPLGWELPNAWDPIAGDYEAHDGWIKLHTNAPHHKQAALSVLDCEPDRDAVSAAIAERSSQELETAIVAAGGCAAVMRSHVEWQEHPQGRAVIAEPLVHWGEAGSDIPSAWRPKLDRPLAGLRVLDLTRILAGPIATRFLAGFGADVLRIDPPDWDEPAIAPDVTLGKRCTRLNLRRQPDREVFEHLLSEADVLVHGYRRDALEALGLGPVARQAIRPGLIDVSLNAYGHSGPWANRRGFDSLVQLSSGIAAAGMVWRSSDRPVSLPVQALDHATGYLMAAAVIIGVRARLSGSTQRKARLSLARTAELLFAARGEPTTGDFPPAARTDYASATEFTPWGPALRLKSPLKLSNCDMRWERPAQKLGSAGAHWERVSGEST
ncbi:acyl-CoA transferase [Erythrobacteraceae bacterium CFH 75059]|uniref:CoA transferase n=1 Tax=Qipengyuania thermophila TaxID=2509361 RepID=UPI001021FB5F|nr:CoA transferase [Qipengyuania thermophila]TCD06431.1 acyl-CoA transferase [Erythrobacteraceae bacterium CFH 75059]